MVEELDAGAPAKVKIGGSLRPLLSSWCFPWAAFLVAAGRGCLALLPRRLGKVRRVLCARGSLGASCSQALCGGSWPGWFEVWASLASWGAGFRRRRAAAAVVLWGLLLAGVCLRFERAEWGYYLGVVRWPPARVGARRGAKAWQPSSKGPLSIFG